MGEGGRFNGGVVSNIMAYSSRGGRMEAYKLKAMAHGAVQKKEDEMRDLRVKLKS